VRCFFLLILWAASEFQGFEAFGQEKWRDYIRNAMSDPSMGHSGNCETIRELDAAM
jgi:hypothetical protein